MKRFYLLIAFIAITLCSYAQFVLTPSAGLMTEDGPYIINRSGSEIENYNAAKKVIARVIPNAEMGDVEYEKSFNVTSEFKDKGRLPGAMVKTDWIIKYTLLVTCEDGKISISFKDLGEMEVYRKGERVMNIYPTTGSNSMLGQAAGIQHIFNSKGVVASGCKKLKLMFETKANDLVKEIENNLK